MGRMYKQKDRLWSVHLGFDRQNSQHFFAVSQETNIFLELISVNTLLGWMEEKYITFKHLSFIILPKISFVSLPITALATVK